MRQNFSVALYEYMSVNPDAFFITGDLGYGIFDRIKRAFPNRFINTGAAEQSMLDIAIGLSLAGKIPFVYSITPFLLHRPYESIKLYLEHEQIPVILVGSGRMKDYEIDGISHWIGTDPYPAIKIPQHFPPADYKVEEFSQLMKDIVIQNKPAFISLKR